MTADDPRVLRARDAVRRDDSDHADCNDVTEDLLAVVDEQARIVRRQERSIEGYEASTVRADELRVRAEAAEAIIREAALETYTPEGAEAVASQLIRLQQDKSAAEAEVERLDEAIVDRQRANDDLTEALRMAEQGLS